VEAANVAQGLELGALDRAAGSVAEAVAGAKVVFCAAPVAALPGLVAEALAASDEPTVVSDVGSTKRELIAGLGEAPGADRFIGGHPLAGAETAGVENARGELLDGARWYLTPTERSSGLHYDLLQSTVSDLGARPQAIDPAVHDRVMATVSHLPHVLANVLVSEAAALIRSGDRDAVDGWHAAAGEDRRRLLESEFAGGDLRELRIGVENRPGTVAEIALALGHAQVNIEDMALYPAPDMRTGAISVWVAGMDEAERAAEIVRGLGHVAAIVGSGE